MMINLMFVCICAERDFELMWLQQDS